MVTTLLYTCWNSIFFVCNNTPISFSYIYSILFHVIYSYMITKKNLWSMARECVQSSKSYQRPLEGSLWPFAGEVMYLLCSVYRIRTEYIHTISRPTASWYRTVHTYITGDRATCYALLPATIYNLKMYVPTYKYYLSNTYCSKRFWATQWESISSFHTFWHTTTTIHTTLHRESHKHKKRELGLVGM